MKTMKKVGLKKDKRAFGFKRKLIVVVGGVQETINQVTKKAVKKELMLKLKCEMIKKYGVGYKPLSYHMMLERRF